MRLRTKFLQVLPLLGLAILQSLSAVAAPSCPSLLETSSVHESELSVVINQLAHLKIQVDQAQAQGSANGTLKTQTKALYNKKWQELLNHLGPSDTQQSLKDRVAKEIQRIQFGEQTDKAIETKAREAEAKVFGFDNYQTAPHYSLASSEPFRQNHPQLHFNSLFKHLPKRNSLLMEIDGNLVLLNLQNKQESTLFYDVRSPHVFSDEKRVIYFEGKDLVIGDLELGKITVEKRLDSLTYSPGNKMRLSPIEDKIAIYDTGFIALVDIQSGKTDQIITGRDFNQTNPLKILDVDYMNDQTLIIRTDEKLIQYNLDTKKSLSVAIENPQFQIKLDQRLDEIPLFYSSTNRPVEELIVYSAETLEVLNKATRPSPSINQAYSGTEMTQIPRTPGFYLIRPKSPEMMYQTMIVQADNIKTPVFDFNKFYSPPNTKSPAANLPVAFSSDRKELFIVSSNVVKGVPQYYLDHWMIEGK
jgi:hypothetical protein